MRALQFIQQWLDYAVKYAAWYAPVKKFQDEYINEHGLTWTDYEQINNYFLFSPQSKEINHLIE